MQPQEQLSRQHAPGSLPTVTQHAPGSLPNTKPSELIPKRRGVRAPTYVSTEQHYTLESTTTEGAPVAEGLYRRRPTPLETQEKKNDRDRSTLTTGYSLYTRAQFQAVDFRQNLDANQSN